MVHWVHSTKGRAREVVVPQSAAVLAHFRQQLPDGIQLAGPEIKIANNFVSKGDRKPDLHLEKLVAKVVEKVQRVCQYLQNCDFIDLANYKKWNVANISDDRIGWSVELITFVMIIAN